MISRYIKSVQSQSANYRETHRHYHLLRILSDDDRLHKCPLEHQADIVKQQPTMAFLLTKQLYQLKRRTNYVFFVDPSKQQYRKIHNTEAMHICKHACIIHNPKYLKCLTTSTTPPFNSNRAKSSLVSPSPATRNFVLGTLRVRPYSVATLSNVLAANTISSLQEHTTAASSTNRHYDSTKELGLQVLSPTSFPSSLNCTSTPAT